MSCLYRDGWARRQRQILAIDAQHYTHRREQYNMRSMLRELNKVRYFYMRIDYFFFQLGRFTFYMIIVLNLHLM